MCANTESLCSTLETNVILYNNHISIKKNKTKYMWVTEFTEAWKLASEKCFSPYLVSFNKPLHVNKIWLSQNIFFKRHILCQLKYWAHEHFREIYLNFIVKRKKAILISSAPVMRKAFVLYEATVWGTEMVYSQGCCGSSHVCLVLGAQKLHVAMAG